jgi:hypothetical protein
MTDIHHGRKGNSRIHNQDCTNYVKWFCEQVKNMGDVTHVAFLGDWYESRSSINIETLDFSYTNLDLLNSLGLPVIFCVGNHDLHRRTTRDVHSVRMFEELSNFTVIDKPTVIDGCLFSPFLFEEEYPSLAQYNNLHAWFGHFEFQGFCLTGYNTIMEHGPDGKMFLGPKKIFSGHFHKRQSNGNIHYIGNTFPMDHGDAGDFKRGMAVYSVLGDAIDYLNWQDAPKYLKTPLSSVLSEDWVPPKNCYVKCVVDQDITYTDAQNLREMMIKEYNLRDFIMEENKIAKQGLLESDTSNEEMEYGSVDDLIISQLSKAINETNANTKYDLNLILDLYKNLKVEQTTKD